MSSIEVVITTSRRDLTIIEEALRKLARETSDQAREVRQELRRIELEHPPQTVRERQDYQYLETAWHVARNRNMHVNQILAGLR